MRQILMFLFFLISFTISINANSVDSAKYVIEIKTNAKYIELINRYDKNQREKVEFELNPKIMEDHKKRKYINFEISLNGHTDYIVSYYIDYKKFGFIIDMK